MPSFFPRLALAAAIAFSGSGSAQATGLYSDGLGGGDLFRVAESNPEDSPVEILPIEPYGLCCSNIASPVIPLGTPMREPIVLTAPGMPGQSAPVGITSISGR